jgi:hypothetical protein
MIKKMHIDKYVFNLLPTVNEMKREINIKLVVPVRTHKAYRFSILQIQCWKCHRFEM